jgi:pimeloyl-ACP methyl ester carboxylesterase
LIGVASGASPSIERNQRQGKIMADIFVGGFGDGGMLASSIVADYQTTYAKTHSGSVYFEWKPRDGIVKYLDDLPLDEQINLIGHSYGGDTAGVITASYKRRINVLVTIDPVGSGKDMINSIRGNCTTWVDVNARPSGWFNLSNIAAGVGQAWNEDPKGIATFYIEAPFNHEEFSNLMTWPDSDGQTAAMILARCRTAAR